MGFDLNWKALVLIAICLFSLNWMEYRYDGNITTITVVVDVVVIFVGCGVVTASTASSIIEKVVVGAVKAYLEKYGLTITEAVKGKECAEDATVPKVQ